MALEITALSRNNRLILPLSLRHNLMTYILSGSKLLVQLNGNSMPGGSYTFIKSALEKNAKEELTIPNGTIRVVFDNEQVVGKKYTVSVDNPTVPISVITSHAYLVYDKNDACSTIQRCESLSPKNWYFEELDSDAFTALLNFPKTYISNFCTSRNKFIQSRIDILANEQLRKEQSNTYRYVDPVDEALENEQLASVVTKEKCDPYGQVDIEFLENNIKVMVGEPDPLNPNSFANIACILRNIGKRAGVKKYCAHGTREWIFIENDGGIYTILIKLITNVVQCLNCFESFYGVDAFENHSCFILHSSRFGFEFDWLILIQVCGMLK